MARVRHLPLERNGDVPGIEFNDAHASSSRIQVPSSRLRTRPGTRNPEPRALTVIV
jgi:hypothetical protein